VQVAALFDDPPQPAAELVVQRVRERTQIVIEEKLPTAHLDRQPLFPTARRISPVWLILAGAVAIAALSVVSYDWWARRHRPVPMHVSSYSQITHDGRDKYLAGTDGSRLYFTQRSPQLALQVAASGGAVAPVPMPIPNSWLGAVSPDGSTIFIISEAGGMTSGDSLWTAAVLGGSLRHLADAVSSAWSPDGETVAYATQDGTLYLVRRDGAQVRKLASIGGFISTMSWSPDNSVLRFSRDGRLWEMSAEGTGLHELLSGWHNPWPRTEGSFGPDGRFYFIADGQIWMIEKPRKGSTRPEDPISLTSGPVGWSGPLPGKDGKNLYAVGATRRGELVRYDGKSSLFKPYLEGISAEFVAFSRDGKSLVYVSYPEGTMWRVNQGANAPVQLTSAPVCPKLPRWSPDGKQIVFVDQSEPGKSAIFVIPSDGTGQPQRLLPEDRQPETDAGWSPDGTKIVFSTSTEEFTNPKPVLEILDLATHKLAMIPASEGLYSPRWSPDGRRIMAMTLDSLGMRIFDNSSRKWSDLKSGPAAFPEWTHDGSAIEYISWRDDPAVLRIPAAGGPARRIAGLKGEQYTGIISPWMGLDPSDSPLMLLDRGSKDIYALSLDEK
jgi:Tol biopolymer transport system component